MLHSWDCAAAVLQCRQETAAALHLRQEITATGCSRRSLFGVEAETLAVEEQRAEPVLVEIPVAHRSGVDMEEPGLGVSADAAASQLDRLRG